ncbi:MAG: DNA repair protein RecN [Salinivirgaceae bacterium]
MLQHLFVQNYALIDELQIDFHSGLTVITGETGAGKSILLGALALALGSRADLNSLKDKEKKCVIEIEFDVHKLDLQSFFDDNGLDYEEQTIIRREITPKGKSRAFINDTPVNLGLLKTIGEQLIDIHSQHQNLDLNSQEFQINFVDAIANNQSQLHAYQKLFYDYKATQSAIDNLKAKNAQQKERFDFIQFQHKELSAAKLKANEQEELEQEQRLLSNSEEIAENLSLALKRFLRDEFGLLNELASAKNELSKVAEFFENGNEIVERVKAAHIDLEDLVSDLEQKAEVIDHDPQKLEKINSRLNQIYTLQQKHNCRSIEELLALEKQYDNELNEVESFGEELSQLEKELATQQKELVAQANNLHQKRVKAAGEISENISKQLSDLGMPHATFKIDITKSATPDKHGSSVIVFMFTADRAMQLREVTEVASGGELSRIMLIIKSLIAEKRALPSLIFDEIDTGVSGEIANKMGNIMQQMASSMQIITITHLPQIAAKGHHHSIVYKTHETAGATTHIKSLIESERIETIARMLSSGDPGKAAMENAKELLGN